MENVLDERAALVEMFKAGFLDGYKIGKKVKTDEDWKIMNEFYKKSFFRRFEKSVQKAFKDKKGKK
ncbi:MAG: hypothetical protein AAB355_00290 [Patescibacteria group bacterium]